MRLGIIPDLRDSTNEIFDKSIFIFMKSFIESKRKSIAEHELSDLRCDIETATIFGMPGRFQAGLILHFSEMADAFGQAKRIRSAGHNFIWEVADAWHRATGQIPTLSRTTDIASANAPADAERYRTPFDKFLLKVFNPSGEGADIIRAAVDAYRQLENYRELKKSKSTDNTRKK